jgi:hypothetical protein
MGEQVSISRTEKKRGNPVAFNLFSLFLLDALTSMTDYERAGGLIDFGLCGLR